jgi:hypothetical protein
LEAGPWRRQRLEIEVLDCAAQRLGGVAADEEIE